MSFDYKTLHNTVRYVGYAI